MNIQAEKIQLAKMLLDTQNPAIIESIREDFHKNQKEDFYNSLSDEEKKGIELGISQVEEGKTIPYEKIVGKYRKK